MQEPWQPPRKGWRMRVEPTNRWAQKPPRTRHKAHKGKGSGRPWLRLTKALRANHPFCQVCHTRPSTEVHHIKPWNDAPEARLDPRNLLAVCRDCHERIEGRRSSE
jgi:5-methylcytosine-specific restriction endonuclease McrA